MLNQRRILQNIAKTLSGLNSICFFMEQSNVKWNNRINFLMDFVGKGKQYTELTRNKTNMYYILNDTEIADRYLS